MSTGRYPGMDPGLVAAASQASGLPPDLIEDIMHMKQNGIPVSQHPRAQEIKAAKGAICAAMQGLGGGGGGGGGNTTQPPDMGGGGGMGMPQTPGMGGGGGGMGMPGMGMPWDGNAARDGNARDGNAARYGYARYGNAPRYGNARDGNA
ncbi:hypothetical protein LTR95_000199 [Oleoguttula sp. CCFEE 5521]